MASKALGWLVLLVLLAGGAYWWMNSQSSTTELPFLAAAPDRAQDARVFDATHASDFIPFTDAKFGYGMSYPVGYMASSEVDIASGDSLLTLTADRFGGDSEVILVRATDDPTVTTDSMLAEFRDAYSLQDLRETRWSGNGATVVSFESQDGGAFQSTDGSGSYQLSGEATNVHAIYECAGNPAHPQAFHVLFVARVPLDLSGDLDMTNFLAHSFACSSPDAVPLPPAEAA